MQNLLRLSKLTGREGLYKVVVYEVDSKKAENHDII